MLFCSLGTFLIENSIFWNVEKVINKKDGINKEDGFDYTNKRKCVLSNTYLCSYCDNIMSDPS